MRKTGRTWRGAGPGPILWWAAGLALAATLVAPAPAAAQAREQWRDELHRVIDLPALRGLGRIDRIEWRGPGSWRVTLGRCIVDIDTIERRLRQGLPGYGRIPPTYTLRAQEPVCRR